MTKENKPSWDEYFIDMALTARKRSTDKSTKCGCVLVKKNNIIGTGYNNYPHGLNDNLLPTERPYKYTWMFHSEMNAIFNMTKRCRNFTAYVSGEPCFNCMISLYQTGCKRIVFTDVSKAKMCVDEEMIRNKLLFFRAMGYMSVDFERNYDSWNQWQYEFQSYTKENYKVIDFRRTY